MSKRNMGTCKVCGSAFEKSVNYGCEYGIVRLDNSGELFAEAELCPHCLEEFLNNQDVFTLENDN